MSKPIPILACIIAVAILATSCSSAEQSFRLEVNGEGSVIIYAGDALFPDERRPGVGATLLPHAREFSASYRPSYLITTASAQNVSAVIFRNDLRCASATGGDGISLDLSC
ncbi:MAG: hypothetical protein WD314_12680 [Trueperaceae bacterium]